MTLPWRRLASGFDDVALWWVDLLTPAPAGADAWLSPDERERAARFRTEPLRQRWERSHVALRGVLGAQLGAGPHTLRFESGAAGKPRLAGGGPLEFSLSHSGDVALIAVCAGAEVGVDVELLHPVRDAGALVARVCSPREQAEWHARAETADAAADFLRGWTRKEACLKAIGTGLDISPARVEVGFDAGGRRVRIPCETGSVEVELRSIAPAGAWLAALARCVATAT